MLVAAAAGMVSRDLVKDWPGAPTPQPPPPSYPYPGHDGYHYGYMMPYPQHRPMPHAMPMTYPQPPSVAEKAEESREYAASVPNSVNEENMRQEDT